MTTTNEWKSTACILCECNCGIEVQLGGPAGRNLVRVRGDDAHPASQGYACEKPSRLDLYQNGPHRLQKPLRRRSDGSFEEIDWDTAIREVAARFAAVRDAHGGESIFYYGGGGQGNHLPGGYGAATRAVLGSRDRSNALAQEKTGEFWVAQKMLGGYTRADFEQCEVALFIGKNPWFSHSIPRARVTLREIANDPARTLIVIDPRRTETAELADTHLFIRPGTDALLLAALVHTILEEKLERPGRLADFTDGLEQVRAAVARFAPERVASPTGIPADSIRALARDFAGAESAVAYGRVGLSTQAYGAVAQWLVQVLNVITGNLDRPGGAMFTRPAVDLFGLSPRGGYARRHTRVRKLPSFGGEFPVAALAEEMLTEGPGRIRVLLVFGGNPVLSTPNGAQLEKALGTLDFMVAVDPYLNETTRHAHLLLPPTTSLERDHYDLLFHLLAVRNTSKWSPPLFPPAPGARHDWQIFQALTRRLRSRGRARLLRPFRALVDRFATPRRLIDVGLRTGPYGLRSRHRLSVSKLEANPHGIDLGPLEPSLPGRLMTPGKRIQLAPEVLVRDLARVESELLSAPRAHNGELLLIGRRDLRSNNSWMHNSQRLVKGPERCTLLMHPDDARARGLAPGQTVEVRSRVGSVPVRLELTDAVMPGVVSLPHGWGHGRPGVQLRVAAAHAGVSLNDLTDDQAVDALLGTAAFSGTPVHVTGV